MSDDAQEGRLPPPAFPPGQRRHVHTNSHAGAASGAEATDDGMISPDDPMPDRRDAMSGAFISPDEPIPERKIELAPEFSEDAPVTEEDGEGVVVGMDLDAHTDPIAVMSGGDPHVMELMEAVSKLSEALNRKGEAGLRSSPTMTRFEATLRSYCVGYLAGRRAEEPPPPPIVDEDY